MLMQREGGKKGKRGVPRGDVDAERKGDVDVDVVREGKREEEGEEKGELPLPSLLLFHATGWLIMREIES